MIKARLAGNVVDEVKVGEDEFVVLDVQRKSEVYDKIYVRNKSTDGVSMKVGERVEVEGEVVTKKYSRDTRKIWFVYPSAVKTITGGWHNQLEGEVTISDEPKLRQTPLSRTVLDLSLNAADSKCYLYAVAFDDYALHLSNTIKKGDKVKITKARLQSRWYHLDTEPKMVNEILITELQKI